MYVIDEQKIIDWAIKKLPNGELLIVDKKEKSYLLGNTDDLFYLALIVGLQEGLKLIN